MPKDHVVVRPWRAIHESWLASERLGKASDGALILFHMLNTRQDDAGRFPWTTVMVRALVAVREWSFAQATAFRDELAELGVVTVGHDGIVTLRRGNELNGPPTSGGKFFILPRYYPSTNNVSTAEPQTADVGTNVDRNRVETKRNETKRVEEGPLPSVATTSPKQKTKLPTWTPPDWFAPLATLPGYQAVDHTLAAVAIDAACLRRGVVAADVVKAFLAFWPQGQALYSWKNPVKSLVKTIDVQIGKLAAPPAVFRNGPTPAVPYDRYAAHRKPVPIVKEVAPT